MSDFFKDRPQFLFYVIQDNGVCTKSRRNTKNNRFLAIIIMFDNVFYGC